jgi:hypothetical protein
LHLQTGIFCVIQFKIKVMFICIWSETDLLNYDFNGFSLDLFLFLFLLIKKFLIINYLANRRVSIWRNLNKSSSI